MKKISLRIVAACTLPALLVGVGHAQCQTDWLPGPGTVGTDGPVTRLMSWDPDANGPLPAKIVAAGDFEAAGNAFARHIAVWDPATGEWDGFAQGLSHEVAALATLPNGDLIAGGRFSVGGISVANVARWDGAAWQPIGGGLQGPVYGLATTPAGDIIAVGNFDYAWLIGGGGSTVALNNVAKWSGGDWMPIGTGTDDLTQVVSVMANGDIVIGGHFSNAGGTTANRMARWDGLAWSALGSGLSGTFHSSSIPSPRCITQLPNGDLVVGGNFTTAGGSPATGIARWDGTSWSAMAGGFAQSVSGLSVHPNGNLLATGFWNPAGTHAIEEWDGTTWHPVAPGLAYAHAVTSLPNGDIVAGGLFATAGGGEAQNIAHWNGAQWSPMPSPGSSWLNLDGVTLHGRVAPATNGDLLAIGEFEQSPTITITGVLRYDGSSWQPLGGGIASWPITYPWVFDLLSRRNGDVVVCGWIVQAGSQPVNHIAQWNGAWSSVGGGMDARVFALAELANGDLIAGGEFTTAGGVAVNRIARWDGNSWSPLGSGSTTNVQSLLALPNGDLVASGSFATPSGTATIAKWDGMQWTSMNPAGNNGGSLLCHLANGDIAAYGLFAPVIPATIRSVGIWDGATWTDITGPTGYVSGLTPTPDGGLIALGSFYTIDGVQADRAARWDGTSWSAIPGTINQGFSSAALMTDGSIVATGNFTAVSNYAAPGIARMNSACPATVVETGSGCAGSGGNNELHAASLPWLGSTFRANGTELPQLALVSQVYGFGQTQLPLSALLTQAPPGCDLLVTPDHVVFAVTTNGEVTTELPIPTIPSLVGLSIHHQLNLFEVDGALNILEVTASNALAITVGIF